MRGEGGGYKHKIIICSLVEPKLSTALSQVFLQLVEPFFDFFVRLNEILIMISRISLV